MLEYWNNERGNARIGRAVGSTAGRRPAVPPKADIPHHSITPSFHHSRRGFTLVEIVMAITILAVMMLISFFSFDAIVQSWRAGQEMSNTMGQADYVIDQVVSGLRSAYYPDLGKQDYKYGFQLISDGEDESARDSISWVKMGPALVGEECGFSESPHRVSLSVFEGDRDGKVEKGLALRAWRIDLQLEDFKPDEEVANFILAPRVIGFNCRVLDKTQPKKDELPNWQDEWKFSNSIPKAVEITLYMEPLKEDEEPLEIKRIVEIPMSELSLNPVSNDKGKQSGGSTRTSGTRGQQPGSISRPGGNRPDGGSGTRPPGSGGGTRPPGSGGSGGSRSGGGGVRPMPMPTR